MIQVALSDIVKSALWMLMAKWPTSSRCLQIVCHHTGTSHHITMTWQWARWRLRSPASRLFIQWRNGVSNRQPHGCLLNHSFRCRQKNTPKLRVTGLCVGNSPVTGDFPAQMSSNAENVFIWWRLHGNIEQTIIVQNIVSESHTLLHLMRNITNSFKSY